MNIIWSEQRIREELARLDEKTGLHGADLRITFGDAKHTLGTFFPMKNGSMEFRFSNYWFQNPDWPVESALDVIRHEYAHYMEYEIYGNGGHGATWKACCVKVGAVPLRTYKKERSDHIRNTHKKEAAEAKKYDKFFEGQSIVHPKFGTGTIESIIGNGTERVLEIEFPDFGLKKLGIKWVDENCKS